MTDKHSLTVAPRTLLGKKVKTLRQQGLMVGSVSTPDGKSISIQSNLKDFSKLFDQIGESTLIYLNVDGEKQSRPVLLDEMQEHPITEDLIHVSFRQVSLKNKVSAEVSIEVVGETEVEGAMLVTLRDTVEVEALPTDLPEKIEVDVSGLTAIGDAISLADLKIDRSKVDLVLGDDQDPAAMPVVMIQEIKEEVEVEEPVEGEAGEEDSAEGEEKEADGDEDKGDSKKEESKSDDKSADSK
jgi:large subunit ribosomal protein L25